MDDGYYSDGLDRDERKHGKTYKIARRILYVFIILAFVAITGVVCVRLYAITPPKEALQILKTENNKNANDFETLKSKTIKEVDPKNSDRAIITNIILSESNKRAIEFDFYEKHPTLYMKFSVLTLDYSKESNELQMTFRYNEEIVKYLEKNFGAGMLSFCLRDDSLVKSDEKNADSDLTLSGFYENYENLHFKRLKNGYYRLAFFNINLSEITNLKLSIYWNDINIGDIAIYKYIVTEELKNSN